MCTGLEIAAVVGTAASLYESTKGEKKTGKPKPPPDPEKERAEAKKRSARARARASGGFGTKDTFGNAATGGANVGKSILGG